jgi:hypothetical protein
MGEAAVLASLVPGIKPGSRQIKSAFSGTIRLANISTLWVRISYSRLFIKFVIPVMSALKLLE